MKEKLKDIILMSLLESLFITLCAMFIRDKIAIILIAIFVFFIGTLNLFEYWKEHEDE